ncbi:hypothetical protein RR48_06251 [Papilio machaon]|uniref:Uncharacterized protein n=1 Tax=Papilio machaon TaxID=76193 RepID=A0A194R7E5_PAPMA|nr:hypothetical protein RR48_06251 [Papilio machaon]
MSARVETLGSQPCRSPRSLRVVFSLCRSECQGVEGRYETYMFMRCEANRDKREPEDPPMNQETCEIMCGLNCTLNCLGQLFEFCCKYLKSSTKTGSRKPTISEFYIVDLVC